MKILGTNVYDFQISEYNRFLKELDFENFILFVGKNCMKLYIQFFDNKEAERYIRTNPEGVFLVHYYDKDL